MYPFVTALALSAKKLTEDERITKINPVKKN